MRVNLKAHLVNGIYFSREKVSTYCGLIFTKERLYKQRVEMKPCKNCLRIVLRRAGVSMSDIEMLQ